MRLVFIGSSLFSCIFLLTLLQANFSILVIFTKLPLCFRLLKKVSLSVEKISFLFNIPCLNSSFISNYFCFQLFCNIQIDYIILASCAVFLSSPLLRLPKYGSLNLHPSILPRFYGSNPINYTLFLKDSLSGLTALFITSSIDFGPILFCVFDVKQSFRSCFFFNCYFSYFGAVYVLKHLVYFSFFCSRLKFFLTYNNDNNIITKKLYFSFVKKENLTF